MDKYAEAAEIAFRYSSDKERFLDFVEWVVRDIEGRNEPVTGADPLQPLADQAQELDMGYEGDAELVKQPQEAEEEGWIDWHGEGDCPVDGEVMVEAWLRDGSRDAIIKAKTWDWTHTDNDGDIIRYRVIKDA
jgi:hypothetical protein